MALLFLCLIFGTGRTQKIEAAVQNVPESLEEESRLDTVGTDQETERAAVREKKGQQEKEAGDTETDQAAAAQDELLAELDFDAIQQEVDSLLSSQQFSFAGTVRSLLQDGDPFRIFRAGNAVLSCAKTAFLAQKGLMKELFLLVLAGAVLGSFSSLFEGKQVRDASFYMVYLLALALILKNFQSSGENLKAVITSLVAFMRILTPSYYLAAAAAGGASSAVMFYQMLLLVILAVEKLLLALVLPMIHIYLLIALVNDLSGEEILSHMTELLENLRERPFKIVARRTCGNADDPESDRTGARFPAADGTLADCRNDSRHRKCGECCNRVGGRLRGADPQLLWRDGNAGTARSRHGSRRSASRFGSFLPPSRRGGAARLGQADRGMSCGGRKRICDASASPSDRRSPVSADDCNPGGNFFLERV